MNNRLNKYKYPGAKRLMLEAQELKDKTEDYCAQPIDDNLFEWHFTVRGPPDTAFEGGYYHGYHPETWQPSWSVRTALLALIAFMPTKSNRAIGSLDFSDAERRKLAEKSRAWRCETCGLIKDLLKHPEDTGNQNGHGEASTSKGVDASNCNDGVKHEDNPSPKETSERDNSEDSQSTSQPEPRLEPKINSGPADEPSRREKAPEFGGSSRECNNDNQVEWPTNGFSENVAATVTQRTPTQDNRRTYPTLVYASIFILLFLLVLRRIVMVVQS